MTDALLARARARLIDLNLRDGMPRIDAERLFAALGTEADDADV